MITPSRVQLKVLKAVHARAATTRVMQDRAAAMQRATGHAPPLSWYQDLHGRAMLWQALENAAADAGVPAAWITQCRERGEAGMRWRADLHWRDAQFADRATLLDDLRYKVRQVQDMAAVVAVHGERGAHSEVGTAQLVDRKLRVLSQRINAVATVLKVSAVEADRLWGEHSWSAAAESVRHESPRALAERWRAHARTNTAELVLQAKALSDAGITPGAQALPDPEAMSELIRARLSLTASPESGTADTEPGAQITEAIAAAGIASVTNAELATPTDPTHDTTFTSPPGIEP